MKAHEIENNKSAISILYNRARFLYDRIHQRRKWERELQKRKERRERKEIKWQRQRFCRRQQTATKIRTTNHSRIQEKKRKKERKNEENINEEVHNGKRVKKFEPKSHSVKNIEYIRKKKKKLWYLCVVFVVFIRYTLSFSIIAVCVCLGVCTCAIRSPFVRSFGCLFECALRCCLCYVANFPPNVLADAVQRIEIKSYVQVNDILSYSKIIIIINWNRMNRTVVRYSLLYCWTIEVFCLFSLFFFFSFFLCTFWSLSSFFPPFHALYSVRLGLVCIVIFLPHFYVMTKSSHPIVTQWHSSHSY